MFLVASCGLAAAAGAFTLDVREVNEYFEHNKEARSRIPFLDGNEDRKSTRLNSSH